MLLEYRLGSIGLHTDKRNSRVLNVKWVVLDMPSQILAVSYSVKPASDAVPLGSHSGW
jgi:hypothetical protein